MKTLPGDKFTTAPHALCNIGNLRTIFKLGDQFEQSGQNYADSEIFDQLH